VTNIQLDLLGKRHSLYDSLLRNPPDGFQFQLATGSLKRIADLSSRIEIVPNLVLRSINEVLPISIVKPLLEKGNKLPSGVALTYSAGHLIFSDAPWIVDIEFVTHLAGYDYAHFLRFRKLIERTLAADSCKAVLCWTLAGTRTVFENLHCDDWREKVHHVPLAVPLSRTVARASDEDTVRILFVGSGNIPGQFEVKGGMEVLAAHARLIKKYDCVELVMRSDMPGHWKKVARRLPRTTVLDGRLPPEALRRLFDSAHIFLFPSYNTPGLVFLDAMNHELPIVTTNVWANSEMIVDGVGGFIVPASRRVPYRGKRIPAWGEQKFLRTLKQPDPEVVRAVVEALSVLIEDSVLRRQMGRAGRSRVEKGPYSQQHRNEILGRILKTACESSQLLPSNTGG